MKSLRVFPMLIALATGLAQAAAPGAQAPASSAAGTRAGEAVYNKWCSHCHNAGRGNPGTESLQVKYGGKLPAVLLQRTDLTPDAIKLFVRQGIMSMPPFRKTEISDAELEQLAAFAGKAPKRRRKRASA